MKAVAVFPGKQDSIHLTDLPEPGVGDVPDGRGVVVKVLRVGVDGTDQEINAAEYGAAPDGYDYLTATVRRPGNSIYDLIGAYDMTTNETYYERGINLLHGFLTERYVDDPEYIVKVPDALAKVGVLMEPVS